MRHSIYVAIPLMLVLTILQTAVLSRFPFWGLVPQLLLLVTLGWGLLQGVNEGVLWAFIAGIIQDIFSINPVGITALSYIPAILIILWLQQGLPISRFFTPIILGGLVTIIAYFFYFFCLRLLGHIITLQTFTVIPQQALLHAALMLPIYWLMHTIYFTVRPRPVRL